MTATLDGVTRNKRSEPTAEEAAARSWCGWPGSGAWR